MAIEPIGTEYQFTAPDGSGFMTGANAIIRLEKRHGSGSEVWKWQWSYSDGSGLESDWAPSYRKAADECRMRFAGRCKVRFKKVSHGGD